MNFKETEASLEFQLIMRKFGAWNAYIESKKKTKMEE